MDSDHFYDSFFFCSRDDLESLQLVRKSLHKKIAARSNLLPLRSIHTVNLNSWEPHDKIEILVNGYFPEEMAPEDAVKNYYETSFRDGDFAEIFCRLQNSCIQLLCVEIEDSPFLRYWKAQEAAVLSSFVVASIHIDLRQVTEYDLLDSIANLVRPRTIDVNNEPSPIPWEDEMAGYNIKYLEVLGRDSFLDNLQICFLNVWRDYFPPPSFFLNEPGYPNYELQCLHPNVADGIDAFIESFRRDGCANQKLESVYISWSVWPSENPSRMPKLLSSPTKSDKPLPEAEAMMLRSRRDARRVSQCEMHIFENEKQQKRMEVYQWTLDFQISSTHVLQCLVKNAE